MADEYTVRSELEVEVRLWYPGIQRLVKKRSIYSSYSRAIGIASEIIHFKSCQGLAVIGVWALQLDRGCPVRGCATDTRTEWRVRGHWLAKDPWGLYHNHDVLLWKGAEKKLPSSPIIRPFTPLSEVEHGFDEVHVREQKNRPWFFPYVMHKT